MPQALQLGVRAILALRGATAAALALPPATALLEVEMPRSAGRCRAHRLLLSMPPSLRCAERPPLPSRGQPLPMSPQASHA